MLTLAPLFWLSACFVDGDPDPVDCPHGFVMDSSGLCLETDSGDTGDSANDSGGDSASDTDTATDTGNCSGAAPTIDDFTVSEGDPVTPEGSDTPQPTVLFTIEFSDDDGDAHVISLDMWYDTTIDGTVDVTEAAPQGFSDAALRDSEGNTVERCGGHGTTMKFAVGVTGHDFEYSTEYEFAVVLYDNSGMGSDVAIATGATPAPLMMK